jgi:hypothetical protein
MVFCVSEIILSLHPFACAPLFKRPVRDDKHACWGRPDDLEPGREIEDVSDRYHRLWLRSLNSQA